ncbi:MAG: PQQ-binding-like beta-propeller repeat protein [Acidimicrobiaceae bacterium]|nr:PQQ-binding-like beta-propeller repeat protein [Acidimicrobiaceae bacterium]
MDPRSSGKPWGNTIDGLLTFRGNPTRTYYGRGPVPTTPKVVWKHPQDEPLCSTSLVNEKPREWCGTGWTGQPAIFERGDTTWVVLGSLSGNVHFFDAETGSSLIPDFPTGDIIKGSVTVDPDGYPLVYVGSRDDNYRVIAFDGDTPRELWALNAYDFGPVVWNDDWDGAGLVIDDHLFIGGENSQFFIVKLNRHYASDGLAEVDPQVIFHERGWDDELYEAVGRELSIENSVAISGDTLFFANSGGLIQGWDISGLRSPTSTTIDYAPHRVFRFWAGDDIDASLVIDSEGMIYAGVEYQRDTERAREVGQIIKLNPSKPKSPLVWNIHARGELDASGVWATPGLHRDLLIVPTAPGEVYGIDIATGEIRWTKQLRGVSWSSPVIVDDVWIQGDCSGRLYAFDVSDTTVEPPELWSLDLGGCVESTPAVWDGLIVVGTKSGYIYGIG